MNKQLESFARAWIRENIKKCNERAQLLFRRMYSHKDIDKDMDLIVSEMEDEKLDWAMSQIERALNGK